MKYWITNRQTEPRLCFPASRCAPLVCQRSALQPRPSIQRAPMKWGRAFDQTHLQRRCGGEGQRKQGGSLPHHGSTRPGKRGKRLLSIQEKDCVFVMTVIIQFSHISLLETRFIICIVGAVVVVWGLLVTSEYNYLALFFVWDEEPMSCTEGKRALFILWVSYEKKLTFANDLYIHFIFLLIMHLFQGLEWINQCDALGHILTAPLKSNNQRQECRPLHEYNVWLVPNKHLLTIEVYGIYKIC